MGKGSSGYLKPKNQTVKELNKAIDTAPTHKVDNEIDNASEEMVRAQEVARGMTDRIRNIFND